MADPQQQQQRPQAQTQAGPSSNSTTQLANSGLLTPKRNPNGLGSQLQRAAEQTPAVAANITSQAVLGGLAMAAVVANPLMALALPMINKTLLRAATPLPMLTAAVAGASLLTGSAFRPGGIGGAVGGLVAGTALFAAMNHTMNSATVPVRFPKV